MKNILYHTSSPRRAENEDVCCVRLILVPAALLILFTQLSRLSAVLTFLVSSPERLGGLITGLFTGLYLFFNCRSCFLNDNIFLCHDKDARRRN